IRGRRAELRLICGGEVGAGRSIEGHAAGLRTRGRVLRLGLPLRWADDELSGVTDVRKRRLGRRDEQRDETSADLLLVQLLREGRAVGEVAAADDRVRRGGRDLVDE